MRLNKYLADAGVASRREADRLIEAGKVKINGHVAGLGDRFEEGDKVEVGGKAVRPPLRRTTIAFHKPAGVIVTTDRKAPDNILDVLDQAAKRPPAVRLIPIGRLDVMTGGLILLTDDPSLADRLMRPDSGVEKEYDVLVDKDLTEDFLAQMAKGVRLEDMPAPQRIVMTRPAKIARTGPSRFHMIITEGKNRQVRRMCEALGYVVRFLMRVRVGGVELGDLPKGEWRPLTAKELASLA